MKKELTVKLSADPKPFLNAIKELASFAQISESFLEDVRAFAESTPQIELINFEQKATIGTSDITVLFNPSDKLLEFLATLRARKDDFFATQVK